MTNLHPVLEEKLSAAIGLRSPRATIRDTQLPSVKGKVHAVVGMRRAGKTTYLFQLHSERLLQAQPPEATLYINFEDDRLVDLPLTQMDSLLEAYYRRYPRNRGQQTVTWLLDEIQVVHGWERFVRRILDTEQVEVVVSGSSARLLSREVHTSLRGRGTETIIRPFSFREYLRHHEAEPAASALTLTTPERSGVEALLLRYLETGGFPEAQSLNRDTRIDLLQGYVETVLFRDVVERHGVSQLTALRWLVRHLLKNAGGSFSVHRCTRDLRSQGHGVAKDALHAMFAHLEDAFLVRGVALATESERRRNSNPRKVYPADPGLITAFDYSGRSNIGHALETAVLHELDRRRADIGYVRTSKGTEVDFLAQFRDGRQELIQVCADTRSSETLQRELGALRDAAAEFPRARLRLVVLTFDMIPPDVPPGIGIVPAYRWLLA